MIDLTKFNEFLRAHAARSALELYTEWVVSHGPALWRSSERKTPQRLNEPFWAEYLSLERLLVWERDERTFLCYNASNGLWEPETAQTIKARLSDQIEKADSQWPDCRGINRLNTEGGRSAVIELLRGKIEQRDFFVDRPMAIHCQNTMLRIERGQIIPVPFAAEFRSRNQLTVAYEPQAACPRFLGQLLAPAVSAPNIKLIQKMMGLMLLGKNRSSRSSMDNRVLPSNRFLFL